MTDEQQREVDKAFEQIRKRRAVEASHGITWHGGIRYRNGVIDSGSK
jgi:hypothetical protein